MLFNEIYSLYYTTIAKVISFSQNKMLDTDSLYKIVQSSAFPESVLTMIPALENGNWPIIKKNWTTNIRHNPSVPLSFLEKRWLKSLCLDPKIHLFLSEETLEQLKENLSFVEALFNQEDFYFYDAYSDADDFTDNVYIENFKTAMKAIHEKKILKVNYCDRKGNERLFTCMPYKMEYSRKDGKFRMVSKRRAYRITCNMCRIKSCSIVDRLERDSIMLPDNEIRSVVIEIYDERKALERTLHAFAHFEKSCTKISDNCYRLELHYDAFDETELVIRILSFGPMVKAIEPESFVSEIKRRLLMQFSFM